MGERKLVLIGAGSTTFTRGLLADMLSLSDLPIAHLALVDISAEALQVAYGLAQRMVAHCDAEVRVTAHLDRREELPGADYVVTTIAVGGREAWLADVQIPRRYGIYQPVGDTVGPGGWSRALRHAPILRDIARDVEALCPNAWLFNYSNPMSCLVRAARTVRSHRTIGLCHGTMGTQRQLAGCVGATYAQTVAQAGGINHLTWIHEMTWEGRDVLQMLRDANGIPAEKRGDLQRTQPFSWEMFELYGAFPAPGDRHIVEFFPHLFPGGTYQGGTLGIDRFPIEPVIQAGEARYAEMAAQARGERPLEERLFHRAPGEHEQLMEIIDSIEKNAGRIYFANVPNEGVIPGLPDDAPVEIPVAFYRDRYEARLAKPLPRGVVPVLAERCLQQELNTMAALTGDRILALQALLADGYVSSIKDARQLMDDLLQAQMAHLPLFA